MQTNFLERESNRFTANYAVPASYNFPKGSGATAKRRKVVVQWMIEVLQEFKCEDCVIFSAVNILDRYFQTIPVTKSRLQLVCCACMSIAAKVSEFLPPKMTDWVYIAHNCFTFEDLKECEVQVLKGVKHLISPPTYVNFRSHYNLGSKSMKDALEHLSDHSQSGLHPETLCIQLSKQK